MNSREIRAQFLEYFKSKGHKIISSAPLIPKHDPTLLFVNAGMVPLKAFFLGEEKSPYSRAVSCQKCLRAGGKHSDLEHVGHTGRHHTFFEMLGNFSFNDYFKREAIAFAWELLTEWFNLPEDRLWVSVYEEDEEAGRLWSEVTGIKADRIVYLGAKDNFWQMADTGPCGPCSEIIIDNGESAGCGKEGCFVGCECDRFLELWNLVFMQYSRNENGSLTRLSNPSIDTGMGLERICTVLQGKITSFDTDIFQPIIKDISSITGVSYGLSKDSDISIRIIADHIRAIVFLLSEGLVPSNEGRGYVLRRIIRRASRHARLLNMDEPCLYRLTSSVTSVMGDVYPEILDEQGRIEKILRVEEERFIRTVETGMGIFDEVISRLKKDGAVIIPGEEIFRLYDTYGFPVDLARDIAIDAGLKIDEEGFKRQMQIQRERARASWVGEEKAPASIYRELTAKIGETEFVGYETFESESVIKAIIKDGKVINEAFKGEVVEVFLDKTPFYGESGGQVGDTGEITGWDLTATALDTKKPLEGLHSHIVKIKDGKLRVGDKVKCRIDAEKRKAIMRNHTATHLLHAALRSVLGDHVRQAGSLVSAEKLRFDFTHFSALTEYEIYTIETLLNEKILENLSVVTTTTDIKTAIESGAIALFGERYGEAVRIVSVPGFSSELCGGTHCRATGEIGLFVIISEGSVASGIRRIEALTGTAAYSYLKNKVAELKKINELLKTDKAYTSVEKLLSEIKTLQSEIETIKSKAAKDLVAITEHKRKINGITVLSQRIDGMELKDLRNLADNVRDRIGSGIIFIASAKNMQASMVAMVTKDLVGKFDASKILKEVAEIAGGSGGGRPEMAQGGTKDIEKLDRALESVYEIVRKQVKS